MPFGNGNNQNNTQYTWDSPNNFCGGFAVHAVLEDKQAHEGKYPLDIYREIQDVQKIDFATSPNSAAMLLVTLPSGNGTAMSLPSSMCNVLTQHGLSVFVGYTQSFQNNKSFQGMFDEEVKKIRNNGGCTLPISQTGFTSLRELLDAIRTYTYHIVLANGGTHWVAIKKTPPNQYELYNPADNATQVFTTLEEAIAAIGGGMELILSIR